MTYRDFDGSNIIDKLQKKVLKNFKKNFIETSHFPRRAYSMVLV